MIAYHAFNIEIFYSSLDWDAARQTFGQKVALLSGMKVSDRYDCVPPIKHLNSLRNKLSDRVAFQISTDELLPLSQYLHKAYEDKGPIPTEPREILEQFTTMVCVLFAGMISGRAQQSKR